ncbi:MAG: cyclophilin family peptidyl-prolyl cis-trans isomerase [Verrucomicrobiales bacterium]|jgi:cyclophilin family peptidyl-prolyl cis-trans isomerase
MSRINFVHTIAAVLVISLTAVACSSASDDTSVTGSPDSDPVADGDEVTPTTLDPNGPVNPETIRELTSNLTRADVSGDELTCIADRTDGDSQLTALFNTYNNPGYEFSPEAFTALAVVAHACLGPDSLSVSVRGLSGAADEASEASFAECIQGEFGAEPNGDLAYTGMIALAVGFPVPEGAQEAAINSATTCIGPERLANQLGSNAEQASGFATEVDRDCLEAGIDQTFLDTFWSDIITNIGPTAGIEPLIASCSSAFDSGLPKEVPADFTPWAGTGALAGIDPASRNAVYDAAPPMSLEDGVDYRAVFTIADGEIVIDLFEDAAPITVNAFVNLAQDGFYDGTSFHRVIDGFMAQGGDPSGTGSGGPGYSFEDEASGLTAVDRRGLLAMANSGPDTNGSQFFITLDAATHLDGLHTVFGEIIEGDDVLAKILPRDPQQPTNRGEELISVVIIEA